MKGQLSALKAEILKNKYAGILWVTMISFCLAPIMGGVFMVIIRNPEALSRAGGLSVKVQAMHISSDWVSYFGILMQAVGVGGVLVFGFVASWLFGREYSEGTAKDLLSLPVSRIKIINAKFVVYILWCTGLAILNLFVALLIGTALNLKGIPPDLIFIHLTDYFITTGLTILLGTPIAFFAIWGKGYLAPLGFVALTLVIAQIIGVTGYGSCFPWSVPGLFSGAGGEYKEQLDLYSYALLILTSIVGYLATIAYWNYADQQN